MALLVDQWSTDPVANDNPPPNGAPEGMFADTVNDTMRVMMASQREVYDGMLGILANQPGGADLETPVALADTAWQAPDALVIQPGSTANFNQDDLTIEGSPVYAGLPRGHIDGMEMSNNVTFPFIDIDFAPGQYIDSTGIKLVDNLTTMTKRAGDLWSAGNNGGGFPEPLFSTGILTGSTYYGFSIFNPTTGAVDFGFDQVLNAANLFAAASGFTHYRYLGSIVIDPLAAEIMPFFQDGDNFWHNSMYVDLDTASPSVTGGDLPVRVPVGLPVTWVGWHGVVHDLAGSTSYSLISHRDSANALASSANYTVAVSSSGTHGTADSITRRTNSLGEISYDISAENYSAFRIGTLGWIDRRGKNA